MRDVIGGDSFMDWTAWWEVTRDLIASKVLPYHRADICPEDYPPYGPLTRRQEMNQLSDAACDAESVAVSLSRFGWCLRDAGMAAACEARGNATGHSIGYMIGHSHGHGAGVRDAGVR
jgi:hypothetical protein